MAATRKSIAAAAIAAALLGTASACGQAEQHRADPRPRGSINGCLHAGDTTRLIRFKAPGGPLRAAVVGTGSTGVVLANQTDNYLCYWLPLPAYLAAHGMSVLAFDYGNGDYSAEVQAAARQLRAHGARPLVLVGASIGGAVVIDAGAHLRPQPDAVVSLSAVPEATSYPFPADARRLRSPIFHIGGRGDPETQFGIDTRDLYRASPSPAKRLLLIHGSAHGVDFVGAEAGDTVRRAILAFIREHTHG
jgi:pimeloyl-ACP methyl ester carboxylesterase